MKKNIYLFLRIGISFSLIGILLWMMKDNIDKIFYTVKNANPLLVLTAFSIFISSIFVMGFRLKRVLSVQDVRLSAKESIYLCFLGYFFNNFLPTSIGGDVVKAYYAGKKFNKRGPAFSGVLMDRLLAMVPFTFVPTIALIFAYKTIDNPVIIYFVIGLFIFTLLALATLLNRRVASRFSFLIKPFKTKIIYEKIVNAYNLLNVYRSHKIILAWSFLLSLLGQSLFIVTVFVLAKSIGVGNIPIGVFFIIVPIVSVIGMLPSINGLGVREAGVVYMFKGYLPASTAFALSILVLAILLGASLMGAFIYAFKKDMYRPIPETERGTL